MKNYRPKLVILVVYKIKDAWRGFCSPYDVICEAETKKRAWEKLETLVKLYEQGLKKYDYPKHLSLRPLSEKKDRKVFNIALGEIATDFEQKLKKDFLKFQIAKKEKEEFTTKEPFISSGYYYEPTGCFV